MFHKRKQPSRLGHNRATYRDDDDDDDNNLTISNLTDDSPFIYQTSIERERERESEQVELVLHAVV